MWHCSLPDKFALRMSDPIAQRVSSWGDETAATRPHCGLPPFRRRVGWRAMWATSSGSSSRVGDAITGRGGPRSVAARAVRTRHRSPRSRRPSTKWHSEDPGELSSLENLRRVRGAGTERPPPAKSWTSCRAAMPDAPALLRREHDEQFHIVLATALFCQTSLPGRLPPPPRHTSGHSWCNAHAYRFGGRRVCALAE